MKYTIMVAKDEQGGWYVGRCSEIPVALSQGKTLDELLANMKESIELALDCQEYAEQKERLKSSSVGLQIPMTLVFVSQI